MRLQPISNIEDKTNLRTLINLMASQLSENTSQLSLSSGASTIVFNDRIDIDSKINLIPRTYEASICHWWIDSISNGQFEIRHDIGSNLVFDYVVYNLGN